MMEVEKISTKLLLAHVKPENSRRTSGHTLKLLTVTALGGIPCLWCGYAGNVLAGSSGDYLDK